jgi:phage shock protein E
VSPQYLVAIAILAGIGFWMFKSGSTGASAVESKEKVCAGKALLLDVRTPAEFSGKHIKGALNIPVQELEGKIESLKSEMEKMGVNEVEIYCRSGGRAARAHAMLTARGIQSHSFGGIGSWPGDPTTGCD